MVVIILHERWVGKQQIFLNIFFFVLPVNNLIQTALTGFVESGEAVNRYAIAREAALLNLEDRINYYVNLIV